MSQVNFFITEEELNEFKEIILNKNEMTILDETGKTVDELNPNKNYTILINKISEKYPPSNGLFKSACIDLKTPDIIKEGIVNGRIFAKIGYLETTEENKIYKSAYSKLERWLKKRCNKLDNYWWYSQKIESWSKNGGHLFLGDINAKKIKL